MATSARQRGYSMKTQQAEKRVWFSRVEAIATPIWHRTIAMVSAENSHARPCSPAARSTASKDSAQARLKIEEEERAEDTDKVQELPMPEFHPR